MTPRGDTTKELPGMSAGRRPYHIYPLLGIVLLAVAILAVSYRVKHPPSASSAV